MLGISSSGLFFLLPSPVVLLHLSKHWNSSGSMLKCLESWYVLFVTSSDLCQLDVAGVIWVLSLPRLPLKTLYPDDLLKIAQYHGWKKCQASFLLIYASTCPRGEDLTRSNASVSVHFGYIPCSSDVRLFSAIWSSFPLLPPALLASLFATLQRRGPRSSLSGNVGCSLPLEQPGAAGIAIQP